MRAMRYLTPSDLELVRVPERLHHPLDTRVYIYVDDLPDGYGLALAERLAREFERSFRVIPRSGTAPDDGYTSETRYEAIRNVVNYRTPDGKLQAVLEGNDVMVLPVAG